MPPKSINEQKSKYKAPVKPWVQNEWTTNYLKERNEVLFKMGKLTREQIIEYGLLGVRSSKTAKIITEADDKAKRNARFEEENIVNSWAKWFKGQYPSIPYTIDKVAQRRSKLGGTIHKAAAYASGNPDIFVQCAKGGFNGLYIEQKKSMDIFYKDTRILKPGSDNHNIWQSLYHADLREQGYWVMFSVSLESSKKITERYMSGNPYPMQVFEYYCKLEDYPIFEGRKNFNPLLILN